MTCNTATPRLTDEEISRGLSGLNGWSRVDKWIEKTYQFKNFLRAMSFVNAAAYLAEQANHHPDIAIHYNQVTLRVWTHAAGGLTEFDFDLAKKIDRLVEPNKRGSW
jgi:4a-hydroxytetrahydrobiopterin dehydratase